MFKKIITTTLALTTLFTGMAPAEAGTYTQNIYGDDVTITYVGEVGHDTHIVKETDPIRAKFGQNPDAMWEVFCGDGGHQRWMGDSNTPAWDEWMEVDNTQAGQFMYNVACVWQ